MGTLMGPWASHRLPPHRTGLPAAHRSGLAMVKVLAAAMAGTGAEDDSGDEGSSN